MSVILKIKDILDFKIYNYKRFNFSRTLLLLFLNYNIKSDFFKSFIKV